MRSIELQNAVRFILASLDDTRKVVRRAYGIRKQLADLVISGTICERDFYRITSLLYPQSRSAIWQNYFIKRHGAQKVKPADNRGDFQKNGNFYEYKSSGFNEDNALHIVQIRLWQNCDYVVQSISDNGAITFMLDHEEMKYETEMSGASAAHGTRLVTEESQHIELRMTIWQGSEDWKRWVDRYTNRTLK